jgi:rubredoxin
MIKHICTCGYIYNPQYGDITSGIEKGIKFDDLPEEWLCPFCGAGKDEFRSEDKKTRAKFISFK